MNIPTETIQLLDQLGAIKASPVTEYCNPWNRLPELSEEIYLQPDNPHYFEVNIMSVTPKNKWVVYDVEVKTGSRRVFASGFMGDPKFDKQRKSAKEIYDAQRAKNQRGV